MRRLFVVAVTILAMGCSSRGSAPVPGTLSPEIYQKQPLPKSGWITTTLPTGAGAPYGLVADKHKMWVADMSGAVSEVAMDQHVNNLPLSVEARYLAIAPDNNIWVSTSVGVIVRLTRDGFATYYTVAPHGMSLANIIVGSDGALWFAECSADMRSGGIGTITTAGLYTFFNHGCEDVVANAPDGNIWAGHGSGLTVITTGGIVVGRFGDSDIAILRSILAGSDGAMYVTGDLALGGGSLERVTLDGQITKISYRPNDNLEYMANGPGGNLWFSGVHFNNQALLVAFDPATQNFVERIKAPAVGLIAFGPDGNIWVTDQKQSVYTYVRRVMTLSPRPIAVAVGHVANLNVSETHYLGQWTAVAAKPSIASVPPNENSDPIVVTGVTVGTTRVTVYDSDFNSIDVKIIVTP